MDNIQSITQELDNGTMRQCDNGAMGQWGNVTMEQWDNEVMWQWSNAKWDNGTFTVQWDNETFIGYQQWTNNTSIFFSNDIFCIFYVMFHLVYNDLDSTNIILSKTKLRCHAQSSIFHVDCKTNMKHISVKLNSIFLFTYNFIPIWSCRILS